MFAWFFLSALYLQLVLGYSPLEVGLAFLPGNIIMAIFSIGLSAKLVMRFGIRTPLGVGLGLAALGLLLFARAPVDGTFVVDVLPPMILLGFGAGHGVQPCPARGDGRRPAGGGRARVRCRQHRVHDGRGAGPRGSREPRCLAHGDAHRVGQRASWRRSPAATTRRSSSARSSRQPRPPSAPACSGRSPWRRWTLTEPSLPLRPA